MKNKIFLSIIIILILTVFVIYFYSKKISPVLIKYAQIEGKKVAIDIISTGVSDDISSYLEDNNLYVIEKDNNGNIEMIDYDSNVVNKILSISSKKVIKNFEKIDSNCIKKLPMGVITNNVFFENLGPKIPVKISLDGNVLTSLKTKVKEYGLNSALIEVYIRIEANIDIIIPFSSKKIVVVNEVPISIKITKGNVSSILTE